MTKELSISEPNITALHIITFRMLLASSVMMPALALTRRLERVRREDVKWFLLLSLCEPFLYGFLETTGTLAVDGSLAAVVVATIPLFVPFGMAAAYREKIHPITLLGIVLSLVGISVMLFSSGANFESSWMGLLALAGAVLVAVLYTLVLVKIVNRYAPVTITTYQNFIGLIYYVPVMLAFDGSKLPMLSFSPKMILILLALGVFCSTIAYVFYNYGIRSLGATASCIFTNAIPVVSMIVAIIIGQEAFSVWKAVGMLVVVFGVIIVQLNIQKTASE